MATLNWEHLNVSRKTSPIEAFGCEMSKAFFPIARCQAAIFLLIMHLSACTSIVITHLSLYSYVINEVYEQKSLIISLNYSETDIFALQNILK